MAKVLSFFDSSPVVSDERKPLLLFILDFQDFSCMTCLDSFLELYGILPVHVKTSNAWGILAVKHSNGERKRPFRIAEKKLKGFVEANHISLPILMDKHRIFDELLEEGSGVLLFDERNKTVRRYDFPLTGDQLEEIFLDLTG